jgi:3-oxoacyl-[acyl-carrier protein] reductase
VKSCARVRILDSTYIARFYTKDYFTEIPIGRLGTPDEIAETVLWMIKTGYVTNKLIAVDGGMFPQ